MREKIPDRFFSMRRIFSMRRTRIVVHLVGYITAFILGGVTVYLATLPVSYVWGIFFGVEIHSQASFPMGHMAQIYSAPGLGDQQLIFVVDGITVYRTPDFEPGNVDEKIVWDESGKVVTFIASGRKIFTYDTRSEVGTKE